MINSLGKVARYKISSLPIYKQWTDRERNQGNNPFYSSL
jgi:hypothetical protein